jgi:GNAT superfamily N-acetyltransferase
VDEVRTVARLALRAAQAGSAVDLLACTGAAHRALEPFGSVLACDLGVTEPWSVQVSLAGPAIMHGPTLPVPAELDAALAWARERSAGRGYLLGLPDPVAAVFDPTRYGLRADDRLPVLALGRAAAAALEPVDVTGLDVGPPSDLDELLSAYGGWMQDDALAAALIVHGDLGRPRRRFLVARMGGRPVGCALVWFAGGTAYLSGLGVLPAHRGRGYGAALAVAAARTAAMAPVDTVWMYATGAGERLYLRLGFQLVGALHRFGPRT